MSALVTRQYTQTRLTLSTKLPFKNVIEKLYASIGHPSTALKLIQNLSELNLSASETGEKKDSFVNAVNARIGDEGFMIFGEFDHGSWLPLFDICTGRGLKRIILGNPLFAETMLKHELTAGLAVPVEILVIETDDGTDIVWNEPSGLVVGAKKDDEALMKAAKVLDGKLKALIESVCAQ